MHQNRVLYIQYTNPAAYPPLEHSSRILANGGWRVLFLGTGAHGDTSLRFPPHPNVTVKEIPFCPAGWRQKIHYIRYCIWTLYWAIKWQPQWIYASDASSSPIALALSFLPGLQIIYHEHDTPELASISPATSKTRPSRFQRLLFWSRSRIASRVNACIFPNEERARMFSAEMKNGDRVKCVWNCPSEIEAQSAAVLAKEARITLWYHGSIVPAQLPETVVRALVLLPEKVQLKVAGYETIGHIGHVKHLQNLACELGIPECFEYVGTHPVREQLLQQCSSCHVGLALFFGQTRQPMVGASNKPFDYLACGLALLVPDASDWQDFFVRPGYGLTCDPKSAQSIAAAISWFLDHRAETQAMGKAGRQRILRDWNYETQFAPIEQMLSFNKRNSQHPHILNRLQSDRVREKRAHPGNNGLETGRNSQARNRVLYIQYTNPAFYPPLEHSSRILGDAGWSIVFLGTSSEAAENLRFPRHENILVKQISFCRAGWRQKLHYVRYALWVIFWAIRWRPNWIYASDHSSSPVALALSFWSGWRVVYHEHDTPDLSRTWNVESARPRTRPSRYQEWMLWSRRQVARKADLCIIPNEERARVFRTEMNNSNRVVCVWNCPGLCDVKRTGARTKDDCLSIWYHGSIVPPKLPETIIKALALLSGNVRLRLAGYETIGYLGYLRQLKDMASELGIDDRVEYLGVLTREELMPQCQSCDVGLALFRDRALMPMIGATNKPFEYLACGLALLVPNEHAWKDIFVAPRYGLGCDPESPESIAATLQWCVDNKSEIRAMGEAGRQRVIAEWNYETQFAPVQRLLRKYGKQDRVGIQPRRALRRKPEMYFEGLDPAPIANRSS